MVRNAKDERAGEQGEQDKEREDQEEDWGGGEGEEGSESGSKATVIFTIRKLPFAIHANLKSAAALASNPWKKVTMEQFAAAAIDLVSRKMLRQKIKKQNVAAAALQRVRESDG